MADPIHIDVNDQHIDALRWYRADLRSLVSDGDRWRDW